MKKIVVLLFLFILSLSGATARTITVCKNCSVKTVKTAISVAKAGDTVLIRAGTYPESGLIVRKPLTIIGSGYPVIDGKMKGEIFTVEANRVTISGLKIRNVPVGTEKDNAAVRLINSHNFVLKNLILENPYFGIYLQKSSNGKILNNKITGHAVSEFNSGNAIHLWHCDDVDIIGNTADRVRDGIYLEFSSHIKIERNLSKNNVRYGLHFMLSHYNKVDHNVFQSNGAGVAVMFSKFVDLSYNRFEKNWGTASYGMLLKELNDSKIRRNVFTENTVAITVEGSNRIDYQNNDFQKNGWAVKVKGGCYENRFFNNNFISNSFDLSYSGGLNDNLFDHNFWSEYRGYDLNRNGIGDVPYRPMKLFSYITDQSPQAIMLLRSFFIRIVEFAEKVSPIFTPDKLLDKHPRMKKINHDRI